MKSAYARLQAAAAEKAGQPCTTPTQRPRPTRAVAESELKQMQREYAETGRSMVLMQAYLNQL